MKRIFIGDVTPVDLDYNIKRKKRYKKQLEKQGLKWSYASSYGFYIGFKAIVIEHESALPVAILIHSGAPHDSKIFNEILENLQRRRIIQK